MPAVTQGAYTDPRFTQAVDPFSLAPAARPAPAPGTGYSLQDQIGMIDQYRTSDPAMAYALYNGFGGMNAGAGGGALTSALRQHWGQGAAQDFVNTGTNRYGNSSFDPTTGQFGMMGEGGNRTGTVAGYDPSRWDANAGRDFMQNWQNTGSSGMANAYDPAAAAQQERQQAANAGQIDPADYARLGITGNPAYAGQVPGLGPTRDDYLRAGNRPLGATGAPASAGGTQTPPGSAGAPAGASGAWQMPTRPASNSTPFDFLNDAGLKFRLEQGFGDIQNSAAAGGMLQSGQTLKDLEKFRQGVSSEEYDKAFGRYTNQRDFGEDQFRSDRGFGRDVYQDDRNFDRRAMESDRTFQEDARRYGLDFAEAQFRDRRNYQTSMDRYNDETGYNRGIDARDFAERVRTGDRAFDYTARTGDRAFNASNLADLARMGLTGAQGNSQLQQQLMTAIMQSIMQGGGAGAQGEIGQGNNWMNLINMLLNGGGSGTKKP